jgi:hypothetical protein
MYSAPKNGAPIKNIKKLHKVFVGKKFNTHIWRTKNHRKSYYLWLVANHKNAAHHSAPKNGAPIKNNLKIFYLYYNINVNNHSMRRQSETVYYFLQ